VRQVVVPQTRLVRIGIVSSPECGGMAAARLRCPHNLDYAADRTIRMQSCRCRSEFHRLDLRKVIDNAWFCTIEQLGRLLENAVLPGRKVERNDGRRPI
jgi:hypothetical protein